MLLLVDGTNALMRRATVVREETPEAVAQDVLARIGRACKTIGATHLVVCFDSKESYRAARFPGYKSTRTLDTQRYVRAGHKVFTGAGLVCRGSTGWEADDVIATLAAKSKLDVATLSSDNDLLALAGPRVTCWQYAPKGAASWLIAYGVPEVIAKFGVHPKELIDLQALIGGKNDLPGVPGIGKMKARTLINRFGSIVRMIDHQAKTGERILGSNAYLAELTRDILRLNPDVPIELPGSECKSDFFAETK